jgi:hypothetical protein
MNSIGKEPLCNKMQPKREIEMMGICGTHNPRVLMPLGLIFYTLKGQSKIPDLTY